MELETGSLLDFSWFMVDRPRSLEVGYAAHLSCLDLFVFYLSTPLKLDNCH